MQYCISKIKKNSNMDISGDNRASQKLRKEVKTSQESPTSQQQVRLEIDGLSEEFDFSETLT